MEEQELLAGMDAIRANGMSCEVDCGKGLYSVTMGKSVVTFDGEGFVELVKRGKFDEKSVYLFERELYMREAFAK